MQSSKQLLARHDTRIRNLLTAAGLCLIVLLAGSSTVSAEDGCDHPKDFAAAENCFAAQFPCPYSYLGVDGTRDYARALDLCTADNSGAFIALIYLNGEGTPRNLEMADAALKLWKQKSPDHFSSSQAAALENAVNECRRGGTGACPRINYCKDLAEATLDLEICDVLHRFPPKLP